MIISKKQHDANCRNSEQSTGPKSKEGKEAVRFNALTWGLRARSLMLAGDLGSEYQLLWDELAAEWNPQTTCERHHIDTMAISQWLLIRSGRNEVRIYEAHVKLAAELAMLDRVSVQRVRAERSFITAVHKLKESQKERMAHEQLEAQARKQEPAKPAKPATAPPTPPPNPEPPSPAYVMSDSDGDAHPVSCAPDNPDSR